MVIKKDPRAVLELLSQPVPVDEDTDFLDKLEKKVDFHDLPDKPAAPLDVDLAKKANEEQEAMLRDLNNAKINDESAAEGASKTTPQEDVSKKTRRFFALFQGVNKEEKQQTSVPENVNFEDMASKVEETALPQVGDTEDEKIAQAEDLERRKAYLEYQAKLDEKKGTPSDAHTTKTHDKFVAIYDDQTSKK